MAVHKPHETLQGEEAIIALLAPLTRGHAGAFGLKDDCALLTPEPGTELVLKTDPVAEGVHFMPDDAYVPEDVKLLRKADGTGFFMVKLDADSKDGQFSLGQYRLKLTYRRNNKAHVSTSQVLSQAGNEVNEIVTLDIPVQTQ